MSSCLQVRFLLLLLLPFGSIHCANITKSKSNEENKNQWRWETKRRNPENPEKRIVFQDSLESELSSSNSGSFTQNFCFAFFFFFFFATVCMPCNFYCYFAKLLSIDLRLAQVWSMFSCQFFGRSSFFCSCQSLLFDYKSLSMKIKPKE